MGMLSVPLSCNTNPLPSKPVTWPLITLPDPEEQVTWTATLVVAVPLPPATVQFCTGLTGCVETLTRYGLPLTIVVLNGKVPLARTGRVSVPLSSIAKPVLPLDKPVTTTLIV